MPFKSKAQIKKFGELVKQGKMQQSEFDKWMSETPDAHKLPERLPQNGPIKSLRELKARAKTIKEIK